MPVASAVALAASDLTRMFESSVTDWALVNAMSKAESSFARLVLRMLIVLAIMPVPSARTLAPRSIFTKRFVMFASVTPVEPLTRRTVPEMPLPAILR